MRFLINSAIILTIICLFIIFFGYFYYSKDLPNLEKLDQEVDKKIIQIDFSNDEIITTRGNSSRFEAKFYEFPEHLINAVIAIEDQKFFTHSGFDIMAIIRASYVNYRANSVKQGASTITQQVVKNLFLTPQRTFKRKIQELILSYQIEQKLSKEQILTIYLNKSYFGSGNYGIASASKYYFNKDVSKLTLRESALLAGLLKAPSKLSPKNDMKSAKIRANLVLKNMYEAGFIDDESNVKDDLIYKTNRLQRLYFGDFVFENFNQYLNNKDLKNKKIIVKTTLNQKIQEKLEDEINKFSDFYDKKLQKSEIAAIIMSKDGAILAMSGGKDYQKSQYNRAIYAKRQAGSLFKTFIYLTAFEKGFLPNDVFEDKKIELSNWLPNNYEDKYFGEVSLKTAFAKSLNSVSIQLAQKIGLKEIAKNARKLGISSKIDENDLSIALGTSSLTLFELTTAYSSIANDTTPIIPYYITEIYDGYENILYKRQSSGFEKIFSDSTINYSKEILREVVVNGTAKKANVKENIYGKTGTSQDYKDAWFIGFDDNYVIGIWIGNDDNSKTNNISGGTLPAELFAKIISRI